MPEWVGKTDDAMPPKSVFLRLFRAQDGLCVICTRKLRPQNITRDHIKPLVFGGENRETNLQLICTSPCSRDKSGGEQRRKAKADRGLAKQLGLKSKRERRHTMPGSRNSPWKRRFNKHTGRWETVRRD